MACDSRLSLGDVSKTDIAIKLLRMPCRIYGPWHYETRELVFDTDVAMLVSGSHITSALTKESLEEVLRSLQAVPGATRISFSKVVKICFVAYQQISRCVCEALAGPKGIAGVHLAGFCPEQQRVRVFEFTTDGKTNEHHCEEVLLQDVGFRFMGCGKQLAQARIRETGCNSFEALRHVIDTQQDPDVGGPIQYGRFEQGNAFRIYLQAELQDGVVRYPRGGLDLNAGAFSNEGDDLFINVCLLEQGKALPPSDA